VPSVTRVFSGAAIYVFIRYQRSAAYAQPLVAFVTFYRGT
jgi:hypothetical protein